MNHVLAAYFEILNLHLRGKRKAAGWFLEQAGVKDFKEGKAFVYDKHANIIIVGPGSTASDIYFLSERMKDAVLKNLKLN